MCGIFGYIGKSDKAADIVFKGLKYLEYRGYDSWGVAVNPIKHKNISGKYKSNYRLHIQIKKDVGKIGNSSVNQLQHGYIAIGHTRWATHGGITVKNAHPHTCENGRIAIVHNGIVENYTNLKLQLTKKNHKFISNTDSEVCVHLIEEYYKNLPFYESVRKAFLDMDGLNALIAINVNENMIVGVKNGSPLVIGFGDKENFIASDASSIITHTNTVYFLEDHEMAVIRQNNVLVYNVHNKKKKRFTKSVLKSGIYTSKKGKYKHFMLKEIYEQPAILESIINKDIDHAKKLALEIKKSYGTYLVGCGTAAFACMAGSYIFSKIAKRHVNWAIASEFGFQLEFLDKRSFVVALSQSGETMDTLEAVRKSHMKKARIGALVNSEGSTLYRMADIPFFLHAGIEKSVASTKAFTAMVAYLVLSAYALRGDIKLGIVNLSNAIQSIKHLLTAESTNNILKLAKIIKGKNHIYIVGRGLSYPASLESALKIKEISYIHAEGFAAGELKHGVIALIEKKTACIVYAPHDDTYNENIAGASEMKARGGYIIGISDRSDSIFDYYIPIQYAGIATILPNVVFAQILSYYLSIEKNLDPDMPRNLAKSVTVK